MNKDEIINEETFYKYCYEKALSNNIKNWNLKEFENISNIKHDEEIADYEKYLLGELLENKKQKSLKILKSCTSIFIARLEYLIIRKVR